jgi:nitroreductase
MGILDLIRSRRTIRQFQPVPVPRDVLEKLADAGRLAPSAANLQPLEFIVVDEEEGKKRIFSCLKWAAYIAPEGNPKPGHEPTAYIVVLVNTQVREKSYEYDIGAAVENIILAAWAEGIGSCWTISGDRTQIAHILSVPRTHRVDCVIALGYPDESPIAEDMKESVRYWKDASGRLHVPKRNLKDILHFNKF